MQKSRKILIVDDEPAVLSMMRNALAVQGYEVLCAGNYDAAMNVFGLQPGQIGLLVADVSLPGRSGFELASSLVSFDGSIKVLFVSGHAGAEVFKFHQPGLPQHEFLEKPFEMAAMVSRVSSILASPVYRRTLTAG